MPVDALLIADGLHVPVIPLSEVVGNKGGVPPWQRTIFVKKENSVNFNEVKDDLATDDKIEVKKINENIEKKDNLYSLCNLNLN